MKHGCGQEDGASSPSRSQSRGTVSHWNRLATISKLQRQNSWGAWLKGQWHPSSTQPHSKGRASTTGAAKREYWGPNSHPILFVGKRFHAGKGKLKSSEATSSA